jgi:hypothetical protein
MLDALKAKLTALRAAPVPVDQLLEDIDSVREQIAVLTEERAAIIAAPRPPEEVIGLLEDHLNELAADALDGFPRPHPQCQPAAGCATGWRGQKALGATHWGPPPSSSPQRGWPFQRQAGGGGGLRDRLPYPHRGGSALAPKL